MKIHENSINLKSKILYGILQYPRKKMCSPPKMQDETHSYVKQFYYLIVVKSN